MLSSLQFVACKQSASVKEGPNGPSFLTPDIKTVMLSLPSENPYYSNESSFSLKGICIEEYQVRLFGDSFQSTICLNGQFSFDLSATSDGDYSYYITQSDRGISSDPVSFNWHRKSSISPPNIIYPPILDYKSSETTLTITGACETGSSLSLSGDGFGLTTCESSGFSLPVTQFAEGDYALTVTQSDLAGNSSSVNLSWKKRDLVVIPNDPTLIVANSQTFAPQGGSESYSIALTENNSGASFDSNTKTYTAGTLAGVVDKLTIIDSLGATKVVSITTSPDAPDHFFIPADSGDGQIQTVGLDFTDVLKFKILDRFENGVSAFPVVLSQAGGDLYFNGSTNLVSDSDGYISTSVKQLYGANNSRVAIKPLGSALPDVVGSGLTTASIGVLGTTNNNGNFDFKFSVTNGPDKIQILDYNEDG
ncbi:MAG: hypothetical protein KDD50_13235, partial [Bdellovibrionales bacterium]|nr:hypothetical protein [Bdellovibrionales bacterium]